MVSGLQHGLADLRPGRVLPAARTAAIRGHAYIDKPENRRIIEDGVQRRTYQDGARVKFSDVTGQDLDEVHRGSRRRRRQHDHHRQRRSSTRRPAKPSTYGSPTTARSILLTVRGRHEVRRHRRARPRLRHPGTMMCVGHTVTARAKQGRRATAGPHGRRQPADN